MYAAMSIKFPTFLSIIIASLIVIPIHPPPVDCFSVLSFGLILNWELEKVLFTLQL
ncbi:hypothetical protein LINPERPRIM_LOCUS15070, partial [Linum perenne]